MAKCENRVISLRSLPNDISDHVIFHLVVDTLPLLRYIIFSYFRLNQACR